MNGDYIDMNTVERKHNGHWFSPGAKRFFSSRICQYAIEIDGKNYFVSSEQFDYKSPRLYTVRVQDENGDIDTVGEFQQYQTSTQAWGAIKRMVKNAKTN